jgi:hypothetical protein
MTNEPSAVTKALPTTASKAFLALLEKQTGTTLPSYIYTQ